MLTRIVSGGQTGVDRGALDAALDAGFPCGGFCPPGREAEDGAIPERYPLTELPSGGYVERTIRNIEESDGTLVIHFGPPRGGTERTIFHARSLGKPIVLIEADGAGLDTGSAGQQEEGGPEEAAARVAAFIADHGIAVLNVAGPRASQAPGAREFAYEIVTRLLRPRP